MQEAIHPAREHRLAAAVLVALLALAAPAAAQDTALPGVDMPVPEPDAAAQPDPAVVPEAAVRTAPSLDGVVVPEPTVAAPTAAASEAEAAPAAAPAPAARQEPSRRERRAPARRERRRDRVEAVALHGDRSWERVAALASPVSAGGSGDDAARQAALGLLALCVASAALQLLAGRLRRGALP